MEQNSVDWLKWRKQGIGSSDVSAILGLSPYRTALQIYEQKVAEGEPVEEKNYILEKGKRMEPKIRSLFELQTGKEFAPKLFVLDDYPFMRTSLDGLSEDGETAEFKLVGKDVFLMAKQYQQVPVYYMPQLQHQLLVANKEVANYVCGMEVSPNQLEICAIKVQRDVDYQFKIFQACQKFWEGHVVPRIPPSASDRDYVQLRAAGLKPKLQKWKQLRVQIEELQKEADEIEEWAKGLVNSPRMYAEGIKFVRVTRQGNVNYKSIPELEGVDLDKYRGKSSEYIQMKTSK